MDERVSASPLARRWLWVLIAAGAVARLALAQLPRVIRWDEPNYLWLGMRWLSGDGYRVGLTPDLHYTPLIPILLGPFGLLFSNPEWAGEIWYVACGALLPLPVFALARRIENEPVGLAAATLTAAFPLLTISPLHWGTFSEPPFLLLLFSGLDRLHATLRTFRRRDAALAGIALALAYLARPEGVLYAVVACAILGLAVLRARGTARRQAFAVAASFALAWLVVAAPYLAYLRIESGRFMLTGKSGLTLELFDGVIGKDPAAYDRAIARLDSQGRELLWYSPERFQIPGFLDRFRQDPLAMTRRVVANVSSLLEGLFSRWIALVPVALLALAGGVWLLRRRHQLLDHAYLAAMALPPLGFVAIFIQVRFFAPLVPIVLLWAAVVLVALGESAEARFGARMRHLPLLAATLGVLALSPALLAKGARGFDFGHKAMGLWLRDHTPAGTVVMSRDLAVCVYAERGFAPAPHASFEDILGYARARGATLWATDSRELTLVKPHLADLLDPAARPAGLVEIYRAESKDGTNLVFELPR